MKSVVMGVLVVIAPLAGVPGVGPAGEPPLAEAGLDQQATVGSTVQLDATGSRDPDGTIARYNWTIDAPNGSTVRPDCDTCGTTAFRPTRIGRYNVTVTVTDDDGMTRSDTLYVDVEPGDGPTVSLAGPETPPTGSETTYAADASAGNVPLDRIVWYENGSEVGSRAIGGDQRSVDHGFTFDDETPRNVTATAVDVAGQRANESLVVEPRAASSAGNGGGGGGGSYRHGFYNPLANGGDGGYVQDDSSGGFDSLVSPFTGDVVGTNKPDSLGGGDNSEAMLKPGGESKSSNQLNLGGGNNGGSGSSGGGGGPSINPPSL